MTRKRNERLGRLRLFFGVFLLLSLVLPVSSQTSVKAEYAILIVGDEGAEEMLREEKILINEMGKLIREQAPEERLPIFSYHFNKERERAYCENRLNVQSEDLLFVGIVNLNNKVPLKVVYRIDRIVNPARAAKDILARAGEILEEADPTLVESDPEPEASPSPEKAPVNGESAGVGQGFRVQLGSFAELKHAQDIKATASRAELEVAVVESMGANGRPIYKVLSPMMSARAQADAQLARFREAGFEEAFLTRSGE